MNRFSFISILLLFAACIRTVESSSYGSKGGSTCAKYDEDPDRHNEHRDCCEGLIQCERDWLGDSATFSLCVECCTEPCPNPGQSPHIHVYNPNHRHKCHHHVQHGKAGAKGGSKSYRNRALGRSKKNRSHKYNQEPCAPDEDDEKILRNDDGYGNSAPTSPPVQACTAENDEPFLTGYYVPCCSGLNECTKDWAGNLYFYARCITESCPLPTQVKPAEPTMTPTVTPSMAPSPSPTTSPTPLPTRSPTIPPTFSPTSSPTPPPSPVPTVPLTPMPTEMGALPTTRPPTPSPTPLPTTSPSSLPTPTPTSSPTSFPSLAPSPSPTGKPSKPPSPGPTTTPSNLPTIPPTESGGVCTEGGLDPFLTGSEIGCCSGFVSCLDDWAGTGNYTYLCTATCSDGNSTVCTETGADPYAKSDNGVGTECCSGLTPCLDNWNGDNNHFYLCLETCTTVCTEGGLDPWASGVIVPCCAGFDSCLGNWSAPADDRFYYLCLEECPTRIPFPIIPEPEVGTPPSEKRGIALREADESLLKALSKAVSWGYTWELAPTIADLSIWQQNNIDFVPMIWGHNTPVNVSFDGATALFGFNEPNHVSQANLDPADAAKYWKAVETEANNKGIPVLVAPAVNFSPDYWQPVEWLRAFFAECKVLYGEKGCRVDALSVHAYSCTLKKLKEYLAIYEEFNLPIWLTEFACVEDENRLQACGQAEYMVEILAYLENNPNVTKYSWFSYNFTTRDDGKISEAALTDVHGALTPLGEIYSALVRTSYAGVSSSSPSKLASRFGVSLLLASSVVFALLVF